MVGDCVSAAIESVRTRAAARPAHAGGARQAEVHQLGPAAGEHDVRRLEVAVHHAGAVRAVERVGDLGADPHHLGRRQRPRCSRSASVSPSTSSITR